MTHLLVRLTPWCCLIALAGCASLKTTTTAVLHTDGNALVVQTVYPTVQTYKGPRPLKADECLQLKFHTVKDVYRPGEFTWAHDCRLTVQSAGYSTGHYKGQVRFNRQKKTVEIEVYFAGGEAMGGSGSYSYVQQ